METKTHKAFTLEQAYSDEFLPIRHNGTFGENGTFVFINQDVGLGYSSTNQSNYFVFAFFLKGRPDETRPLYKRSIPVIVKLPFRKKLLKYC